MNICSLPPRKETLCKVCGGEALLHGVVDFNKSCEAAKGRFFRLSGIPVWYHRCKKCDFLFTEQFDEWSPADFITNIYNDGYVLADPESTGFRAHGNAQSVAEFMVHIKAESMLDYGGGDGTLARLLREKGLDAFSWDPLLDGSPPTDRHGLVTSFEVMEHTPTPIATAKQALSMVRKGGVFLFSTLCLDDLLPQCVDNWYIAPRNGHVSIHSTKSLDVLFGRLGWRLHHFDAGHHAASEMG